MRASPVRQTNNLQSHHTGIEIFWVWVLMLIPIFLQSHHTGIEIQVPWDSYESSICLQSHHTGIEMGKKNVYASTYYAFNRTTQELKFDCELCGDFH